VQVSGLDEPAERVGLSGLDNRHPGAIAGDRHPLAPLDPGPDVSCVLVELTDRDLAHFGECMTNTYDPTLGSWSDCAQATSAFIRKGGCAASARQLLDPHGWRSP